MTEINMDRELFLQYTEELSVDEEGRVVESPRATATRTLMEEGWYDGAQ